MDEMITKAHCNGCLGERNHKVLFEHNAEWEIGSKEFPLWDFEKHELLKCLGCERIILRVSTWSDGDVDVDGEPIISAQYYPPAMSHAEPIWFRKLYRLGNFEKDTNEYCIIHDLLQEIYIGLQNNSLRLATLGIRALLEYTMVKKVEDNGSFRSNLNFFEKAGYISSSQNSILNTVLETGHATMHRSFTPSNEDLLTCIDIAENLVASIFIHPIEAERLKKKIPPRS